MRVFIDSDVVISSLLSQTGAAYFLLNNSQIKPVISSVSFIELQKVVERMGIKSSKLETLVKDRFEVINFNMRNFEIKQKYSSYILDTNDAHIIAGAHQAKVEYLISYNLKYYKIDKIRDDLNILVMTPAIFLQYLRSRS